MDSKHDCPICMETINTNINCVTTECGHLFHTNCLFKSFNTNNSGCPLCRQALVESSNDDDDEESLFSENGEEDTEYSEDIRMDTYENENHLLRGFRWLFQQQQDEVENNNQNHSIFDGNSMAITPNSLRNFRAINPNSLEHDLDEEVEQEMEEEWSQSITDSNNAQENLKNIETLLKSRKVSYNQILHALVYLSHPDDFDFIEFSNTFEKVNNLVSRNLSQENQNDQGPMTIDELRV